MIEEFAVNKYEPHIGQDSKTRVLGELAIRQSRYPEVYASFMNCSNEKQVTKQTLALFLKILQQKNYPTFTDNANHPAIVDFGCGDGEFTTDFMNTFRTIHPSHNATYYGIDHQPGFVKKTRSLLHEIRLQDAYCICADFFPNIVQEITNRHPEFDRADIAIVSHACYSACPSDERLQKFINMVMSSLKSDAMAIFIHSAGSDIEDIRRGCPDICPPDVNVDMTKRIQQVFENSNPPIESFDIPIDARLVFPQLTELDWNMIIVGNKNTQSNNPIGIVTVRNLFEFISRRSLEFLEEKDRRKLIEVIRKKIDEEQVLILKSRIQIALKDNPKTTIKQVIEEAIAVTTKTLMS